ncbi:hypothetical protein ACLB1E_01165 [Escherichia coli]
MPLAGKVQVKWGEERKKRPRCRHLSVTATRESAAVINPAIS